VLLGAVGASDEVMRQLQDDLRAGRLSPEMAEAYGSWVDRAGRLSKLAIDARLDDAKDETIRIAGQIVSSAITRILDEIGLTEDQRSLAMIVVPDVLRSLAQDAEPTIEGEVADPDDPLSDGFEPRRDHRSVD